MMDPDENPGPAPPDSTDRDLSDETQDFRLLQSFARCFPLRAMRGPTAPILALTFDGPWDDSFSNSQSDHQSLPRRGEKDFEPHGTNAQQDALAGSRAAMYDALAYRRVHPPDARPVGYLDAAQGGAGGVVVPRPRGTHFRTVGHADRNGVHLRPEEALYLVERGSLELRLRGDGWSSEAPTGEAKGEEMDEREEGVPVGVQSTYAMLLGIEGLTLERYQVYAGLKRSGYIVHRAPDWAGREPKSGAILPAVGTQTAQGYLDWLRSLLSGITSSKTRPMVAIGLYRSYGKSEQDVPLAFC